MANYSWVQFRAALMWLWVLVLLLFALLVFLGFPVFLIAVAISAFTDPVGWNTSNPVIGTWAMVSVIGWCLGWPIVFVNSYIGRGRLPFWTLGSTACVIHIALAFHLGHGWSHETAWEHTKQVGGYGDGIFVNYAFALVWLADAAWAWVSFHSYQDRPRWLSWSIHVFLAFIVFNAAVVFGGWLSRVVFLVYFLPVLVRVIATSRRKHASLWNKPPDSALKANPGIPNTTPVDSKWTLVYYSDVHSRCAP